MKISRRELAQVAVAGVASAQAQAPAPAGAENEEARKQVEANSEILRKFEISTAVEPAFLFKA